MVNMSPWEKAPPTDISGAASARLKDSQECTIVLSSLSLMCDQPGKEASLNCRMTPSKDGRVLSARSDWLITHRGVCLVCACWLVNHACHSWVGHAFFKSPAVFAVTRTWWWLSVYSAPTNMHRKLTGWNAEHFRPTESGRRWCGSSITSVCVKSYRISETRKLCIQQIRD